MVKYYMWANVQSADTIRKARALYRKRSGDRKASCFHDQGGEGKSIVRLTIEHEGSGDQRKMLC